MTDRFVVLSGSSGGGKSTLLDELRRRGHSDRAPRRRQGRLVDQEAEGLRKLNLSRDQILARLWELANLSHQVRGSIAGQIKALSSGRYGKCYWDWGPSHQAFAGVASPAQ
jgi:predicted ATPase